MSPQHASRLHLLSGGLDFRCALGHSVVAVLPLAAPAPTLDGVVIEQDSHTLLALDSDLTPPSNSLNQLQGELEQFEPYAGGTVVIKRAAPLQLFAIVHDLDQEPSWREEWIAAALARCIALAAQHRLQSLGMPLLGAVHGRYPPQRFLELLAAELRTCPAAPQQIWLGVPRAQCTAVIAQLRQLCSAATIPL